MSDPVRRTKTERRVPLPANLVPLLTQREIETYYGVSTGQIDRWRKAGMPDEPFAGQGRRYDLAKCQAWHEANATDAASSRCRVSGRSPEPVVSYPAPCRVTREERLAILGPDVVAEIHARVKEAPEPSDELVEALRRIFANPGGESPKPGSASGTKGPTRA